MERVIQKSLRKTITEEISQLNILNAEFLAFVRKLKSYDSDTIEAGCHRLEAMRADIKDKIKNFSSNVDLLYQMMDRKIAILIKEVQSIPTHEEELIKSINEAENRIQDLNIKLEAEKSRNSSLSNQNDLLKGKNVELIQEVQTLYRKLDRNNTNDSTNKTQLSRDNTPEHENSIQKHVSPLQGNLHSDNNDMTFNQQQKFGSYTVDSNKKKFKSEENSFSSRLIKEQNSFQYSKGSNKNQGLFGFGCMPSKAKPSPNLGVADQLDKSKSYQSQDKEQSHRLSFLLSNLKSSEQKGPKSNSSLEFDFQKQSSYEHETSVLSQHMVKKYHI